MASRARPLPKGSERLALDPRVLVATPEIDRARAFVEDVRASLPGAVVAFARFTNDGAPSEVLLDEGGDAAVQSEWLRVERLLARGLYARVGRAAGNVGGDGLVAIYGDGDRLYALLVAVRRRPFTPAERDAVEGRLREGTELFGRLAAFDGEPTARERAAERLVPALFVLDRELRLRYRFIPTPGGLDPVVEMLALSEGPPPVVIDAVRTAIERWGPRPDPARIEIVVPLPFMLVRVYPLSGDEETLVGVSVERFQSRGSLNHAARKFSMSSRELQVLALVLQGLGTPEIAAALGIAESTAHDHIKRMLAKAKAKNRVELAAKALGWRG